MLTAISTTQHENTVFFRVAWSTRSRPRSEQVLRPTRSYADAGSDAMGICAKNGLPDIVW
jgi:hypothetical protein